VWSVEPAPPVGEPQAARMLAAPMISAVTAAEALCFMR
jgi:hypothetical protein